MFRLLPAAPALALLLLACLPVREKPGGPVHLVIDAGSSGTRFCSFQVTRAGASKGCKAIPAGRDNCIRVPAGGGLADLSAQETRAVLERGLSETKRLFGTPRFAALLGTGGFRRLPPPARTQAEGRVRSVLRELERDSRAEVITGAEEGRLAHASIRLALKPSGRFAILETGGATVQYAAPAPNGVRSVSFPLGLNESFSRLRRRPEFRACLPLPGKSPQDLKRCRRVVGSLMGEVTGVRRGRSADLPLFGLGSSWRALFRMVAKADSVPGVGGDEAGQPSARGAGLEALDELGRRYCSLDLAQTIAQGIPKRYARRTCFLVAYQTELLERTGHREIYPGGESWPRGAAASGRYFPACAGGAAN